MPSGYLSVSKPLHFFSFIFLPGCVVGFLTDSYLYIDIVLHTTIPFYTPIPPLSFTNTTRFYEYERREAGFIVEGEGFLEEERGDAMEVRKEA